MSSYKKFRDQEAEYAEAFRIYDISGNGVLTREDIKYCMNKIGIKVDLDQLMDTVDTNRDGNIDYDGKPKAFFMLQTYSIVFFYS